MTFDRTKLERVLANLLADRTNPGVGIYHTGIGETRIFSVRELSARASGPHFAALERVGWDDAWYNQERIFGFYIENDAGQPVINAYSGLNSPLSGAPVPQRELNELVQSLGIPLRT